MIELYLSSDGKHTVHVSADTPEQMAVLVPHAKALYQDVLSTYGTKAQMWGEAIHGNGHSNGPTTIGKRVDTVEQARAAVAPLCPVHQTPMTLQAGNWGKFWSCHTRNLDGTWCASKQRIAAIGTGQTSAV